MREPINSHPALFRSSGQGFLNYPRAMRIEGVSLGASARFAFDTDAFAAFQ
jgi:hypothetical protein